MAKLIMCATRAQFDKLTIPDTSIVFIKDTGEIWTHGLFFSGTSNYVTLSGTQTITGAKTFTSAITAPKYIVKSGTSSQFLKADGSLDSTSYATTSDLDGFYKNVRINSNEDLDEKTASAAYWVQTDGQAKSVSNAPFTTSFGMWRIYCHLANNVYRLPSIAADAYGNGKLFNSRNSPTEWYDIITTNNYTSLVKKIGTSNVGGSGNPIYLKSGVPTKCNETLSVSITGSAASVGNKLILKINGGSTEGTSIYTYNGSSAKTLNITPGSNTYFNTSSGTFTINSYDQKASSGASTGTKLFLLGATSQSTSGQTVYSNVNCYVGTDNCLYSGGSKVSVTGHTHSTADITSLSGYTIATANSDLTTSDSLNTALGKLAYKGNLGVSAYNIITAATDSDGTIENLNEVLKVLQGISDTDTIQSLLGKYLPLTGGTMTGAINSSSYYDSSLAALPTTGKLAGLTTGHSRLYGNALYISNPRTSNDQGWIRVTGTGEADTVLEVATGDDGGTGEQIAFRYYNISNVIAYQVLVPKATGTIALTSLIPSALKNPNSLTIQTNGTSLGSYDGSSALTWNITASNVGAIPLTGSTSISGTLRSSQEYQSTSANAFRAVYGNYGAFLRNDGNSTYILLTNSGDLYGSWNSYRPLTIVNSTGVCNISGNAATATALTTNAGSSSLAVYFSSGKPVTCNYSFGNASGNAAINNGTVNTNLNADMLDGIHASSFFKTYVARIPIAYIDNDLSASGNSDYANYQSGTYCISRTGSSDLFINFALNDGSTSALQLKTSYADSAYLYFRKTIDSNRTSGAWRYFLTDLNYTNLVPTKTGSGASGTWGISITGNAASATKVIVNYNNTNNSKYPLVWCNYNDTSTNTLNQLYKSSNFYINPATGYLYATTFSGNLAGNASSATTAERLSGGTLGAWGTLTSANGYSLVSAYDYGTTLGAYTLAGKGGQLSMQLDGFFYLNEGNYRVLDTSMVSNKNATLARGSAVAVATVGSTNINVTLPNDFVTYSTATLATANGTNLAPQILNIENETFNSTYGSYWYVLNLGHYSGSNYASQIALPYLNSISDTDMFIRTANNSTWRNWRRVLHTGNYSSIIGFTNKGATLSWGTSVTIATIGGVNITATLPSNPNSDTHWSSYLIINNAASSTANTSATLTNGNVYLNLVENGAVRNSHKITGSGATTVTSDASGNLTISSTNTVYTHPTQSAISVTNANGLVLSGITVNTLGHVTGVTSKTLTANDIPTLSYLPLAGGEMTGSIASLTIYPRTTTSYTLGDSSHYWSAVYASTFYGSLSGTASNANALGGISSEYFGRVTTIDASSLNVDYYYPVTFQISSNQWARIDVNWSLGGTVPSWSTHSSGYTVNFSGMMIGCGWGTTPSIEKRVLMHHYAYCAKSPLCNFGQMTNSSTGYIYVRGGGRYIFRTDHLVSVPTLRTADYTSANQTISVKTSIGDAITPGTGVIAQYGVGTVGSATVPMYLNNGTFTACTASSLFSNLSNSSNALSITVAGQNRTLTVAYATSSGSASKVTNNLTLQYNGTSAWTYNGDTARTLNIKPGSNVTVSGDSSGNITIAATNTTYSASTGLTLSSGAFSLNTATTSTIGGIKVASTSYNPTLTASSTTTKCYPVLLNSSNVAYVQVPWTDNNTTYSTVTSSAAGLAPAMPTSTTAVIGTQSTEYVLTTTSGGTPTWRKLPTTAFSDNNTTYSTATNSSAGLIKPWYNHTAASTGPTAGSNSTAVTVNAITATAGRYYALEMDSNGRGFVNVPWSALNYCEVPFASEKYYLSANAGSAKCYSGVTQITAYYNTSCYIEGECLYSNSSLVMTEDDIVTSTAAGIVPAITMDSTTISSQSTDWVLTSRNGAAPVWRKLPSTAYANTNTTTTTGTSSKTGTKMYLVGATSLTTSTTTYSNANCYIGTDNCLYSGGSKVSTTDENLKYTYSTSSNLPSYAEVPLLSSIYSGSTTGTAYVTAALRVTVGYSQCYFLLGDSTNKGVLQLITGSTYCNVVAPDISSAVDLKLPSKSGTIATTDDILSSYKIEVVSTVPTSPDSKTIYFVVS